MSARKPCHAMVEHLDMTYCTCGQVRVELVLDMEFSFLGPENEGSFKATVAQDVAGAIGGDVSKVRVLKLEVLHSWEQLSFYHVTSVIW